MELNAFWAALLRRWYLTLAGTALAIAVTVIMVAKIGPTYKAEGALVLFPPTATISNGTVVQTEGNPYLMLGGLSQARDIVLRTMGSSPAKEKFSQEQPMATYEATPDYTTSGPVILVAVEADTPTETITGLRAAMESVPATLRTLQSGLDLPEPAYITSKVLTSDTKAQVVRSGQIRTGIVVAAGAFTGALLLLGLIDGLLEARTRRTTGSGRRGRREAPSRSVRRHPPLASRRDQPERVVTPQEPVPTARR